MGTRFTVGKKYSRLDVQKQLGAPAIGPRGPWGTGYVEHNGEFVVFANVGIAGRTGDDHGNRWVDGEDGGHLEWAAKTATTASQPFMRRMLDDGSICHIFTREKDRDDFLYRGRGHPVDVHGEKPVRLRWVFTKPPESSPETLGVGSGSKASPLLLGEYVPAKTDGKVQQGTELLSKDPALLERALKHHAVTQNALAKLVSEAGFTPASPKSSIDYDLAWEEPGGLVLVEVKSLTSANEVSQIRHGIGQLLDYASRLESSGVPVSRLVLALEREPTEWRHWEAVCGKAGVTLSWAPAFTGAVLTAAQRETLWP